jgi:hypothetical protein
MRTPAPLLTLLMLTTPALADGQGDSLAARSPAATAAQLMALAHLQPNRTVRVHVLGQGWLSGPIFRNQSDTLVLGWDNRERAVPVAAIDSALERHGHVGMGAGLGALAGLIIGASAGGCEQPPARSLGEAAAGIGDQINCGLVHMAAGVAVGAVVGAVLGAAIPSWKHRVPVEIPPSDAPSPLTNQSRAEGPVEQNP